MRRQRMTERAESARGQRPARLSVESLEGRQLLSAGVSASSEMDASPRVAAVSGADFKSEGENGRASRGGCCTERSGFCRGRRYRRLIQRRRRCFWHRRPGASLRVLRLGHRRFRPLLRSSLELDRG